MIILGLANDRGSSYLGKLCRIAPVQVIFYYYLFVQWRSLFVCKPHMIGGTEIFWASGIDLQYLLLRWSIQFATQFHGQYQKIDRVRCFLLVFFFLLVWKYLYAENKSGKCQPQQWRAIITVYRKSARFWILLTSDFYFFYKFNMPQVIFVWPGNPKTIL